MPLNPLLAQQIDTLFNKLGLEDVERIKQLKQNLETSIVSVANESNVKDESKFLRIETHYNILVNKLLDNIETTSQELTQITAAAQQEIDKQLQYIEQLQMNLINKNTPMLTLHTLQDAYVEQKELLNIQKNELSIHLGYIQENLPLLLKNFDKSRIYFDLSDAMQDLYPNLVARLIQYAESLHNKKATEYFKTFLHLLKTKDEIRNVHELLVLSGSSNVVDININALHAAMLTAQTPRLSKPDIRKQLIEPLGIEFMLAAILLMVAKEQQGDYVDFKPVSLVSGMCNPNNQSSKYIAKGIAAKEALFLETNRWLVIISKDQFSEVALHLLGASGLNKATQEKIIDLIDLDLDLISSNPEKAQAASLLLQRQYNEEKAAQQNQIKASIAERVRASKEAAVAAALAEQKEIERQHASVTVETYAAAKQAMNTKMLRSRVQGSPTKKTGKMPKMPETPVHREAKSDMEAKDGEVVHHNEVKTPDQPIIIDENILQPPKRHPKR